MDDDEQERNAHFEHRIFVMGFSLHVLAGTLATIATFLDFNWQSPAIPHLGDPQEPITAISGPLTGFILFYLVINLPATLAWSTSAGWSCNTGFIWLLAAAGFHDNLRKKKVRMTASSIQSIVGLIALGFAISVSERAGFHPTWGAESNWTGSIAMLAVAVFFTICAAILAALSPTGHRIQTTLSGWAEANSTADDKISDRHLTTKSRMMKIAPKTCGDLGPCGMCNLFCSFLLALLWFILVGLAIDFRIKEPASRCYAILPQSAGELSVDVANTVVSLGLYEITVSTDNKNIVAKKGAKTVFSTIPSEPFVRAGFGSFRATNEHEMGTYNIEDTNKVLSTKQRVTNIATDSATFLTISGVIEGFGDPDVAAPFSITFNIPIGTNHLAFELTVNDQPLRDAYEEDPVNDQIKLYWIHDSVPEESFFGFGQSFTYWDLKGSCVPIITREQGIGRGLQPFTYFINRIAHEGAGSWQTTYSAVPHYTTSRIRSFFLDESFFSVFDMTRPDRLSVELVSNRMKARFLSEDSYLDTIEEYTKFSGRMRILPEWVGEGAIIGLQGGTEKVKRQVDLLLANGVPLTGVWLQDWSGRRVTSLGDRLLWNWIVDDKLYPGWWEMVAEYRERNISILTYVNPYLADYAPDEDGNRVIQPMFEEARTLNCLVKTQDDNVLIQISATSDFSFATVDLTNPACQDWYVNIIQTNMMNVTATVDGKAFGSIGWMADFAESLPFNAKLFNGDAAEIHNRFPALWASTCRKAITLTAGGVDFEKEAVFFTRSSYSESPSHTTLMWLGDQMQAFNRFDGLETVIPGTLSMGLSGFSLSHSDIGGYLGFSQLGGAINLVRTEELLRRWMELSAFMEVMYRSHEGIIPRSSPQITSNNSTMQQFGRFARIFKALHPYRRILMLEAETKGYPVARHPMIHFSNDPTVATLRKQVMLGSELMLCMVTVPGATSTECYLPAGSGVWTNFFDTTSTHDAGAEGLEFTCSAPLGRPCALVRQSGTNVLAARAALAAEGFEF